ncbi:BON domain-containing protein [Undibacterium sp. TS12]|uniref:BON domain-containing protein n=1 Tax=Undibacterium sp. TS12 TaxID=2908202 RepID=UPI001F4D3221|nr:BON domain-containing protein [Undibacterium sp. TS12]MCH8618630.1 BON domain-containing protein [Undibacterium sp. TS12]
MNTFLKKLNAFFLAALVVSLFGCASTATKESTGEYIDDTVITTKVKAAIVNDATLKATEINVETYKGVVQLSGFVADPASVGRAATVASGVKGVKSVKNDIRMK